MLNTEKYFTWRKGSCMRVLLVEEFEDMAFLLTCTLRYGLGAEVVLASTVDEGFEMMRSQSDFDLVVASFMNECGYDYLERLREARPGVQFLVMDKEGEFRPWTEHLSMTVDGFRYKLFTVKWFEEVVRGACYS